MKHYTTLLFLLCGLFYSCQQSVADNPVGVQTLENKDALSEGVVNNISISTADLWINDWQDLLDNSTSGYLNTNPVHSFVMDRINLEQVISAGAHSSRLHLGFDGSEVKLMLVGVDAYGNDMLDPDKALEHFYDYSVACPPTCGQLASNDAFVQPPNSISTATANTWINAWKYLLSNSTTGYLNTNPVHSFSMEKINLEQVLAAEPVDVRFHLGFDGSEVKLIIVGIDDSAQDMINPAMPYEHYYDYTHACPPKCSK